MPPRRTFFGSTSLCLLAGLSATAAHATDYQRGYLVSSMTLPTSSSQYAIDLDGDGHPENNFGSLAGVLAAQGVDLNGAQAVSVASGGIVHLVSLHSTDRLFVNDAAAQADWYVGLAAPSPPRFDGTANLPVDSSIPPATFLAALSGGSFTSADPATTTTPVELTLELQFGSSKMALALQDARLSFTLGGSGHMQGQINGSILHADILNVVLPTMATWFNEVILADPTSNQSMQILEIFDTGCGASGGANDGVIEVCELSGNAIIQTLLAADVQIGGIDANSFGAGFTAIASPDRVFADGFDP